jgi:Bacteriophage baseplate protein W
MPDDSSFLGTGWSFPPTFASNGADVETVSAAEDVRQSLEILLGTQPGERILLEQFGCDLHRFLFEEVDQGLVNSLTGLISDAILFYEPRITLNDLDVSQSDAEAGLLLISIDYTIRTTNSRYNMVYPFYLNEGVAPGG